MDSFLQDDLRSLLAIQERPCISLFQRTTRGAGQEDKIRWKNQVRAAEEQLVAHGQRISDAKAWLRRARELLDEVPFWQNVSAGLAAFLSPQQSRFYRLPLPFNEQLVIGDHFQIKPLLPLLREASEFFVLALSKKNVRLSRGNRHRMGELHLQQVPTNLVQALQYGDETKSRSFHTHTAPGGAATRREAIFHGQGPGIDSAKDGLLEFFQMVDRGLHAYLRNERAPLVIAAADFLLPIYRQANTYPHLLDEGILGHPDRWSARELRDRAWGLVEPLFRAERNRIAALYRQLAGTGRTAKDATEIVPAAYRGQIQYLFVAEDREMWGRFDPSTQTVRIHEQPEPGDEDLLNLAAMHSLAHKAKVFGVESEEIPDGTALAAVYWLPIGERSSQRVL